MANGFSYTCCHEWANLGQGAPEVGPLPDAPTRPTSIPLSLDSLEYAPTTGVKGIIAFLLAEQSEFSFLFSALREAVANLYNVTYRQKKASKYTYENVCIVPGGRSGLSRIAAVIGDVYTVNLTPPSSLLPSCRLIPYGPELPNSRLHRIRPSLECIQKARSCSYSVSYPSFLQARVRKTLLDWTPR
jgi:hypothetical protein